MSGHVHFLYLQRADMVARCIILKGKIAAFFVLMLRDKGWRTYTFTRYKTVRYDSFRGEWPKLSIADRDLFIRLLLSQLVWKAIFWPAL
jgi:hypothetical protein